LIFGPHLELDYRVFVEFLFASFLEEIMAGSLKLQHYIGFGWPRIWTPDSYRTKQVH